MTRVSQFLRRRKKAEKSRGYGIFSIFVAIAVGLTIVGIMLAVNVFVLGEIYDTIPLPDKPNESASYAHNITNLTIDAAATAASWLNIYTIIAIAAAIMAIIFGFGALGTRSGSRGGGGGGMRGDRF